MEEAKVQPIANEGEAPPPSPPTNTLPPVPGGKGEWARYAVCGVCRQILSGKMKKLLKVGDDLYIHRSCKDRFVAIVAERMAKDAALRAKQEKEGADGKGRGPEAGVRVPDSAAPVADDAVGVGVGLHGEPLAGVDGKA